MESEKFDLVFSGALLPQRELAEVKANMGALFKLPEATIEKLFSGKPVVLKRSLDLPTANKYRIAIKKAGARVDLVKSGEAPAAPAKASAMEQAASLLVAAEATAAPSQAFVESSLPQNPVVQEHPSQEPLSQEPLSQEPLSQEPLSQERAPSSQKLEASWDLHPVGARMSDEVEVVPAIVDIPDFDIAEAGADLIQEHEREIRPAVAVDVSGLSMRENAGNLLDDNEVQQVKAVDVADLAADILPAGSNLIQENERQVKTVVQIAELDVGLAPVGARLSDEKRETAKAPNTDHIKLAD